MSAVYDVEGVKTEYFGYVDTIVKLNFDSFDTVLFKCQFWDSKIRKRGTNATVFEDECGFDRVKAGEFLRASSIQDDPFIFPKDVSQLFYVEDAINEGWKIVVKVQARSNLVAYKRSGVISEASEEETPLFPRTIIEQHDSGGPLDTSYPRMTIRGDLVAVEADDDA